MGRQLLHSVVSEGMDFWNKRLRDIKKTFELLGISQQVILKNGETPPGTIPIQ